MKAKVLANFSLQLEFHEQDFSKNKSATANKFFGKISPIFFG